MVAPDTKSGPSGLQETTSVQAIQYALLETLMLLAEANRLTNEYKKGDDERITPSIKAAMYLVKHALYSLEATGQASSEWYDAMKIVMRQRVEESGLDLYTERAFETEAEDEADDNKESIPLPSTETMVAEDWNPCQGKGKEVEMGRSTPGFKVPEADHDTTKNSKNETAAEQYGDYFMHGEDTAPASSMTLDNLEIYIPASNQPDEQDDPDTTTNRDDSGKGKHSGSSIHNKLERMILEDSDLILVDEFPDLPIFRRSIGHLTSKGLRRFARVLPAMNRLKREDWMNGEDGFVSAMCRNGAPRLESWTVLYQTQYRARREMGYFGDGENRSKEGKKLPAFTVKF